MVVAGSILSSVSSGVGMTAAAIAVGGFAFHAAPALFGKHDEELRRATVIGGLIGFSGALFVILLSALMD